MDYILDKMDELQRIAEEMLEENRCLIQETQGVLDGLNNPAVPLSRPETRVDTENGLPRTEDVDMENVHLFCRDVTDV